MSQKSNMHTDGESDGCVIPSKCPNNGGRLPEEGTAGRQPTKENIGQATVPRTHSRIGELSDWLGVRHTLALPLTHRVLHRSMLPRRAVER